MRCCFGALAVALALTACGREAASINTPTPGEPTPPPGQAALPEPVGAPAAGAWVVIDGARRPAAYLCDGLDQPRVIVVLKPDADGSSHVAMFSKTAFGPPRMRKLTVGEADAGAGQIYFPLSEDGAVVGHLRTFNPGVLDDPAGATLPTLTSVKLDDVTTACRWVPRARLLGFTARRSLLVSQTSAGGLAYTTFDFRTAAQAAQVRSGAARTTTPSLNLESGSDRTAPGGPTALRFENEGYGYVVEVGKDAAAVSVSLGGAPIQTEPLIGYVYTGP